jgi:hypothetical protein
MPGAEPLSSENEVFQLFNPKSVEAIGGQILDTLTPERSTNPSGIFDELKAWIDAAADYAPRSQAELALAQIKSRTIHLAIPYRTAPLQWRPLYEAMAYAKRRGVSLVITRIRD